MSDKVFISTTGNGLARASRLASGQWEVKNLLLGSDIRCMAPDPLNAERVYAGTQGQGVLRSDDHGETWRAVGLAEHAVKAIAASPLRQGVVYAGTKPACLFVSEDGGATWAELAAFRRIPGRWFWLSPAEPPFIGYVQAIAFSPTDPQRVVVGIEAGAIVLSKDGGQSWTSHRRGALRDCHTLTFHAVQGDWVYAGGGGIMAGRGTSAYSRDAAQTWTSIRQGLDHAYGWAVAADPAQPEVWYLSASPGAFKAHSTNNAQAFIYRSEGSKWRRLAGGLPQPLDHMPYALLTDNHAPGHIYAGLSNGDIWQSADYGEEWIQLPVNLGKIERSLVLLSG
jgi:photosystem II stability/assembly factor-like uncharacterized protein